MTAQWSGMMRVGAGPALHSMRAEANAFMWTCLDQPHL